MFFDDFKGNKTKSIHLSSLNTRSEIWLRFPVFHVLLVIHSPFLCTEEVVKLPSFKDSFDKQL